MDTNEAVQELKAFVLKHGLPETDMALFGVNCPYCGKSDRIRELEKPGVLTEKMDSKNRAIYLNLWDQLTRPSGSLGVCKFCQNILLLEDKARAAPLYE